MPHIPGLGQVGYVTSDTLWQLTQQPEHLMIMGGGPIAGLAREVAHEIPVPVLDGVSCAIRLAEMLIDLNPAKATKGSFARPPGKPTTGLSPALARYVEWSG